MPAFGYAADDLREWDRVGIDPHAIGRAHICQEIAKGCGDMRGFYARLGLIPTSERADIVLIRSHVAYWGGSKLAGAVTIRPSRGHSYRVVDERAGRDLAIVRITDHYDHREGVRGWMG